MRSTTISAALTALFAASAYAGITTVTLETRPCAGVSGENKTFDVVVNQVGVTPIDLRSICGLNLISSATLPLAGITCQAFKDAEGTDLGSLAFTFVRPALISTNPVDIGSVWCRTEEYNGGGASSSATLGGSTGRPTLTLGQPTERPTMTLGVPTERPTATPVYPGGNGTVVGGGPGAAGNTTTFPGGAARVGMGMGVGLVGVAGLAVLVL